MNVATLMRLDLAAPSDKRIENHCLMVGSGHPALTPPDTIINGPHTIEKAIRRPASSSSSIEFDKLEELQNLFDTGIPGECGSGIDTDDTAAHFTECSDFFENYFTDVTQK
ncbi:hypothetical protein ACJJTC_015625 [Scirpophaga incertulas]